MLRTPLPLPAGIDFSPARGMITLNRMTQNDRDAALEAELHTAEHRSRGPRHTRADDPALRTFVIEAARRIADLHGEDILVFDVRGLSQLTDYIILATGTSDRQMKSVASDVAELGREHGLQRMGSERDDSSTWIVMDFVDAMVHLFEPATRAHYDLEMMWGDAPRVPWRRP